MVTSKRLFDLTVSVLALGVLSPLLGAIAVAVLITSSGPALHWSERVGRNNRIFHMPKFRTMHIDTPQLATHLLREPERWVTPVGRWLRTTSLDELPQLWSVCMGHMSLVGPRPALFNQDELTALRTQLGVHLLRPGLTGWAQVNGRDELPIPLKVEYDADYAAHMSLGFDLLILFRTVTQALLGRGISH